jgi:hypothetical protein
MVLKEEERRSSRFRGVKTQVVVGSSSIKRSRTTTVTSSLLSRTVNTHNSSRYRRTKHMISPNGRFRTSRETTKMGKANSQLKTNTNSSSNIISKTNIIKTISTKTINNNNSSRRR